MLYRIVILDVDGIEHIFRLHLQQNSTSNGNQVHINLHTQISHTEVRFFLGADHHKKGNKRKKKQETQHITRIQNTTIIYIY